MHVIYIDLINFNSAGSFAGLGFLSLYLSGKIKAFDRRGHVAKLCIVFLPLLAASLVAVSRVDDYWHHWQDVFAGGILGSSHIKTKSILYKISKLPFETNKAKAHVATFMLFRRACCGSILL